MMLDLFTEKLKKARILPVFCPKTEKELDTFLCAVTEAGLPSVEITLRSDYALVAIQRIKEQAPRLFVGAGTVTDEELASRAIEAGADYLVSPGYTPELIAYAQKNKILFIPGCSTPSEIQNAMRQGVRIIKLFPAEASGGIGLLSLYAGAFSNAIFIPTGGITVDNFGGYLAEKNVLAVGGSFMINRELLALGDAHRLANTMMEMMGKE